VFQAGSWCAYPWRPGYAQVGRVHAVGEGVHGWSLGDRVFTLAGHADYAVRTDEDMVVRVPEEIDPLDAVASRMASVAFSAVVAKPFAWFERGWVVVYGLGMVGNLAAQCYRALGASVIGIDPIESRRRLAQICGINHVVATGPGVAEAVRALTGGTAPHIVIEATGRSDVALEAVGLVGDHGHVVLLGSPRAAHSGDITGLRRNSIARPRNTGTKRLCAPSNSPPHSRGGQVFRSSPRNGGKDKWCRHECIDVPLLVRSPRGDCPAAARTTLLKC